MCSSFPRLLIGRTAVHSGKGPAFVAYDQFLSTGILQPLSRGEVHCGSKPVKLGTSKCFQVCLRKRTFDLRASESGLSICAFLKGISSGERLALRPRRCKLLTLAGQPQIMPRQVFGLGLALGARQVILKMPPRPRARAPRAVVEQPRLSIRELVGRPTANPEREQLLAMGRPVGAH